MLCCMVAIHLWRIEGVLLWRLVIRLLVECLAKAIGKTVYVADRDGRLAQPTEGHVSGVGPPYVRTSGPSHVGAASRTGRGCRGCSWVA